MKDIFTFYCLPKYQIELFYSTKPFVHWYFCVLLRIWRKLKSSGNWNLHIHKMWKAFLYSIKIAYNSKTINLLAIKITPRERAQKTAPGCKVLPVFVNASEKKRSVPLHVATTTTTRKKQNVDSSPNRGEAYLEASQLTFKWRRKNYQEFFKINLKLLVKIVQDNI
jgi:hypothetical protein